MAYQVLQVGPNIIAMYPSTSLFIAVGQLAIVVLVMFSYPLQVHPCRNCLDKVFQAGHGTALPKSNEDLDEDEDEIEPGGDEHGHHAEMSPLKHSVLTAAIIACGFTVAYLVNDLQMGKLDNQKSFSGLLTGSISSVLSFVGATGSTTISFILPGLFFWKVQAIFLSSVRNSTSLFYS